MPGFVVTISTQVLCSHGGKATPLPPVGRVTIAGSGVVTLAHAYVVAGCGQAASSLAPCVSGRFTVGTTRVRTMGSPLAIDPPPAPSTSVPYQTPLVTLPGQVRVYAT